MSSKDIKNSSFSSCSVSELMDRMLLLKKEMFNFRFQRVVGEVKNTSRIRILRRQIAVIMTELSKRKIEGRC
jgi:large subunit ribosomal protein L29